MAESDPDTAAWLLRRCLEPKDPPAAWRLLASLELEAAQAAKARRTLLAAVVHHPDDAYAWLALARLDLEEGRTLLGVGAIERAYRARPTDPAVAEQYQSMLRAHGRPDERRAARIAPLLTEADGRLELGDAMGALETLDAAASAAAGDSALLARIELRRGLVFARKGRFEEGAEVVARALSGLSDGHDPRLEADLYVLDSELALGLDDPARALVAAERALALLPRHPLARTNRALASLRLGRSDDAVDDLFAALDDGLARRLDREDFLELPGVRTLVGRSSRLAERVDEIWPPTVD